MSDEKCCPYCFEYLVQRPTETNTQYAKRRYCGKSCATAHLKPSSRGPKTPIHIPRKELIVW